MSRFALRTQRGVASLALALLLVLALFLCVAASHRGILFDTRTTRSQLLAAQAQEAAESGIDWVIAQLNSGKAIGADCRPVAGGAGATWSELALSATLQATCVWHDAAWSCACPSPNRPEPPALPSATLAFRVEALASEAQGLRQWQSLACSGTAPACLTDSTAKADPASAQARVRMWVGRVPGLDTLPAAALTVRASARIATPDLGLHHTRVDTGGLTLHSGGPIDGTPQAHSTPGTPPSASMRAADPALAHLTAPQFFASVFRLSKAAWRAQPTVRELACEVACDSELTASGHTLWWLRGGLRLDTPITLGTPDHPVLLVVDGPVQLNARVTIHGVIYSTHGTWVDTVGTTVRGAVLVETDLHATGPTQIHHDDSILAALHERSGSFARLPGSWRDH